MFNKFFRYFFVTFLMIMGFLTFLVLSITFMTLEPLIPDFSSWMLASRVAIVISIFITTVLTGIKWITR